MDAYTQLTVRYRRDIPELFKYNAFVVISDGANNKYGLFFSSYDFFYAWRKIESSDTELDGINSLLTMVKGMFRKDRLLAVIKDFVYFPDNSDKARYTDWATREDIKANLQVDLILLLDEFDYPPVTIDDVYKEVLEQAENFKKYSK